MAYTIKPEADWALVEEFRKNPIGHHSPNLLRLLNHMRKVFESEPRYVLVMHKPLESWVLGQLWIGSRDPIVLDNSVVFTSREDAEWAVFCIRWLRRTGISITTQRSTPLPKELPC